MDADKPCGSWLRSLLNAVTGEHDLGGFMFSGVAGR